MSVRSIRPLALLLVSVLAGCQGLSLRPPSTETPAPSVTATAAEPPSPTAPPTFTPTVEVIDLPTAAPSPTLLPSPTPDMPWLPGAVNVYPGPLHYDGDVLSFEIAIENANRLAEDSGPRLVLDGEQTLSSDPFATESPLRHTVLVYRWVWDTAGMQGLHRLTLEIPAETGAVVQSMDFYVNILPADQRSAYEANATWEQLDTECCEIHYVTGTAAHRDIEAIADEAEASVDAVEAAFGIDLEVEFPITLIDNIWGNGAYAGSEIVISYVDRAYVSIDLGSVLRHEATHYAARDLEDHAPAILVEGIAVYVSGGHYKPEPIPARTAALLELGTYMPLADLADHFRARQHENAYLEAAGLIAYLVELEDWETFLELYSKEYEDNPPSAWLDRGLREVYGLSLEEVEAGFIDWLEQQPAEDQVDDLRLTAQLFDTIRRYQALYAVYQEALPYYPEASERGMTAEFVREANAPENIALEALLIEARQAVEEGRTADAEGLIAVINRVLETADFSQPPVRDYLAIARALQENGYEAVEINLDGDQAVVTAIPYASWPHVETLSLAVVSGEWQTNTD